MSGRTSDDRNRGGPGREGGGGDDYLHRPGGEIDPGDSVPPGVAPLEPAPLTEEDRQVLEKLRNLPKEERRR